jgi:hypothetical protein
MEIEIERDEEEGTQVPLFVVVVVVVVAVVLLMNTPVIYLSQKLPTHISYTHILKK